MKKIYKSMLIPLLIALLPGGTACLQPERFELDVNGPDGLFSFAFAINAGTPGSVTLSTTALTVREAGTATYTVQLSSQPGADVVVAPATNGSLSFSPASLTFTALNWDTAQSVTVTGVDNSIRSGSDTVISLAHTVTSTDSSFDGRTATLDITVQDNEKFLFVTGQVYVGQSLGGLAGADGICNGHSSRPDTTKTYKAWVIGNMSDGSIRRACSTANCNCGTSCNTNEGLDWILQANTTYLRTDGTTVIGTTNAAAIIYPFPWTNSPQGGGVVQAWTGMDSLWLNTSLGHCEVGGNSWSGDDGNAPIRGVSNSTTGSVLFGGGTSCLTTGALYCVEQ